MTRSAALARVFMKAVWRGLRGNVNCPLVRDDLACTRPGSSVKEGTFEMHGYW